MTERKRKIHPKRKGEPVIPQEIEVPKRRGRPRTGQGYMINVRWPPADVDAIDAWIESEPDDPSRPEAIRRLVHIALKWRGPRK